MEHARPGLEKIVADALRQAPAAEAPVLAWPLACGPVVAARTRALDFANGILRVEVRDQQWCNQLRDLAPKYLATLNQAVAVTIARIEFVFPDPRQRDSRQR